MWGMRYLSSVRLSAHSSDREAEHCTAKRHRQQDVLITDQEEEPHETQDRSVEDGEAVLK